MCNPAPYRFYSHITVDGANRKTERKREKQRERQEREEERAREREKKIERNRERNSNNKNSQFKQNVRKVKGLFLISFRIVIIMKFIYIHLIDIIMYIMGLNIL